MKSGNEVKFSEVRCGKVLGIASHHTPKKLVYFDFLVVFLQKRKMDWGMMCLTWEVNVLKIYL